MTVLRTLTLTALTAALVACGSGNSPDGAAAEAMVVTIDGSSTVFPISEAVAEEFQAENKARVTIGVSGTGGGFKKFCAGEIAITGASRHIKQTEQDLCAAANIEFIELPVAYDGISVVVHPSNDFVDALTVDELKTMWAPEAQETVTNWNRIRDGFPDKKLSLYGPGVDSGTFDYFTKVIVGKEQASRGDYTASEDDNVLVHGVSTNDGALGFFGFAYYHENKEKLKAVPIKQADGSAVSPSVATIADGSYAPLSRPIFIYVRKDAADEPGIQAFVDFFQAEGGRLAEEVGYIALPEDVAATARERWTSRTVGSVK